MRLDSFLIADNATVADGKLYVHGGGITRINALSLPLAMSLTVAVRLLVEEDEIGTTKRLTLAVTDPDGSSMLPPAPIDLPIERPGPDMLPDEEMLLQMTVGMALQFTRGGTYHFKLTIDEEVLRDLRLPVATLTQEQLKRFTGQVPPRSVGQ